MRPAWTHNGTKWSFPGRQVLSPAPGFWDLRFPGNSSHLPKPCHPSRREAVCQGLGSLICLDPGTGDLGRKPCFLWSPRAVAVILPPHTHTHTLTLRRASLTWGGSPNGLMGRLSNFQANFLCYQKGGWVGKGFVVPRLWFVGDSRCGFHLLWSRSRTTGAPGQQFLLGVMPPSVS